MSEIVRGSFVPLFDRLASNGGPIGNADKLLSPEQLEASILRELSFLVNTRSRLTASEFATRDVTTLDYGVPDFSALSPKSESDLAQLQAGIERAVTQFEPRLRDVTVKAFPPASAGGPARVLISGLVSIGLKLRRLNFEVHPGSDESSPKAD